MISVKNHFQKHWVFYFLFVAWVAIFHNNLRVPFFYDDYSQIVQNTKIRDISKFKDVIFCGLRQIRITQNITIAIDFYFSKLSTLSYHITNNLLHLLNTFLLLMFLRKIKGISSFVANLTAIIYLVHPLQIQSVTYLMGRISLLQNFSLFLVLNEFFKFENRSRIKIFLLLLFAYFTKENNCLIPIIFLIADFIFTPERLSKKLILREHLWYFLSVLIYIPLSIILKDPNNAMYIGSVGLRLFWPIPHYFLTQGYFIYYYLVLFFTPHNQSIYYEMPLFNSTIGLIGGFMWLSLIGLFVVSFLKRKKYPILCFFVCYFLIFHGSTNSFLQMINPFAEYRLSVSMPPIILGLCYLASLVNFAKYAKHFIAAVFIIFFSIFTHLHNELWKTPLKLWFYTEQEMNSFNIQLAIANEYFHRRYFDEAIKRIFRAQNIGTQINDHFTMSNFLLASTYFHQKKFMEANEVYFELVKSLVKFNEIDTHNFIVTLYILRKPEYFIMRKQGHESYGDDLIRVVNDTIKLYHRDNPQVKPFTENDIKTVEEKKSADNNAGAIKKAKLSN